MISQTKLIGTLQNLGRNKFFLILKVLIQKIVKF